MNCVLLARIAQAMPLYSHTVRAAEGSCGADKGAAASAAGRPLAVTASVEA